MIQNVKQISLASCFLLFSALTLFAKDWVAAAIFLQGVILVCFLILENKKTNSEEPLPWYDIALQKIAIDQHAIVSITNQSGEILYVNQVFCDLSGYATDELVGQNHRLLNSGHHSGDFFVEMWETISANKTWQGTVCNRAKNGKFYWVKSTIVPIMEKNKTTYYVSVRTDITQQKESELAENKAKKDQEIILNALGYGVITFTAEGNINYLNAEAKRLLCWDNVALDNKSIRDFISLDFEQQVFNPDLVSLTDAFRNKQEFRSEKIVFFDSYGKKLPVSFILSPLFVDENNFSGFALCFEDIRKQLQNKKQILQAKENALQSLKAKSQFLALVSHEIRTPLNGIVGSTDLLTDTNLDDEQSELTKILKNSSDLLLKIVNDILELSKIEAATVTLDNSEFNPKEVLKDSIYLVLPLAHEKSLTLINNIASELPTVVYGDSKRLEQVLLNLLNNAIKFTETGQITIHAFLSGTTEKRKIRFEIEDTGIGIHAEEQKKLFDPFVQVEDYQNRKYGGTGLGLAISKNIVEMMGGEMGVDSLLDKGSVFWFELPLASPPQKDALFNLFTNAA